MNEGIALWEQATKTAKADIPTSVIFSTEVYEAFVQEKHWYVKAVVEEKQGVAMNKMKIYHRIIWSFIYYLLCTKKRNL